MATIIDRDSVLPTTTHTPATTLANVELDIERYWGNLYNEKFFPISKNELLEIIGESPDEVAAIRIKNIDSENKATLSANWIAYNRSTGGTLTNDDHYFVLDFPIIEIQEWFTLSTNSVVARIAKTAGGNVYVYFHRARVNFKNDGGTGGDNLSSGAKIPPNP